MSYTTTPGQKIGNCPFAVGDRVTLQAKMPNEPSDGGPVGDHGTVTCLTDISTLNCDGDEEIQVEIEWDGGSRLMALWPVDPITASTKPRPAKAV